MHLNHPQITPHLQSTENSSMELVPAVNTVGGCCSRRPVLMLLWCYDVRRMNRTPRDLEGGYALRGLRVGC